MQIKLVNFLSPTEDSLVLLNLWEILSTMKMSVDHLVTHIALGMAYKDAYTGNVANTTLEEWERLGYNDSVIHTDMMSTTDRTVTATLQDGSESDLQEGKFLI
jgi:hypothetical protein